MTCLRLKLLQQKIQSWGVQTHAARAAIQLGVLFYQVETSFTKDRRVTGGCCCLRGQETHLGCGQALDTPDLEANISVCIKLSHLCENGLLHFNGL